MDKRLVIIGASGHGKVIADIAQKNGYREILFLDDNSSIDHCGKYSVVGSCADIDRFLEYDCIVGIGNCAIRERIQTILKEKQCNIVTLIHPMSAVAEEVDIGIGSVVMAGSVINSGAVIGEGCIINTCSSVDHDCVLEDYVHIAVGAHIAGTVTIGKQTWIGAGAVISNNLHICDGCMIGAGAVVIKDISEKGTYVGVPAGMIKE